MAREHCSRQHSPCCPARALSHLMHSGGRGELLHCVREEVKRRLIERGVQVGEGMA